MHIYSLTSEVEKAWRKKRRVRSKAQLSLRKTANTEHQIGYRILRRIPRTRGIVEYSCSQVRGKSSMSREYVYFLSHAPTGSLCSLPSFSLSQRRFEYKEKSDPKKRSCSPSQHRTQRPLSTYLGHTTIDREILGLWTIVGCDHYLYNFFVYFAYFRGECLARGLLTRLRTILPFWRQISWS